MSISVLQHSPVSIPHPRKQLRPVPTQNLLSTVGLLVRAVVTGIIQSKQLPLIKLSNFDTAMFISGISVGKWAGVLGTEGAQ